MPSDQLPRSSVNMHLFFDISAKTMRLKRHVNIELASGLGRLLA